MTSKFSPSDEEIARFGALSEDQQKLVLSSIVRTVGMIDDYVNGDEPNFGGVLKQLRLLATKVLQDNTLHICGRQVEQQYKEMYAHLVAGDLSADDIRDRFLEIRADLKSIHEALRKKSGGEEPLGDNVNFSKIGAVEEAEEALYPEPTPSAHTTPDPRIYKASRRSWMRDTETKPMPDYMTREFFESLTDYMRNLEPEAREQLDAYCHGQTKFHDLPLKVMVDLGISLFFDPGFKTAIAASTYREPDGQRKIETNFISFSQRFDDLFPRLESKYAKEFKRGGGGGGMAM